MIPARRRRYCRRSGSPSRRLRWCYPALTCYRPRVECCPYITCFPCNLDSEENARKHMKPFEVIIPALSEALMRAYPRPLLSSRETSILERRALGELPKQIAVKEGITDRTVRMHLQRAKKKLYTDDLVNAVVIADKIGMIGRTTKGWLWQ